MNKKYFWWPSTTIVQPVTHWILVNHAVPCGSWTCATSDLKLDKSGSPQAIWATTTNEQVSCVKNDWIKSMFMVMVSRFSHYPPRGGGGNLTCCSFYNILFIEMQTYNRACVISYCWSFSALMTLHVNTRCSMSLISPCYIVNRACGFRQTAHVYTFRDRRIQYLILIKLILAFNAELSLDKNVPFPIESTELLYKSGLALHDF